MANKNTKRLGNKGFSLVELIVVIAIMAVLVGVLAPQFIKYVESSRQSTDIQNMAELRAAIEAYVADENPTKDVTVSVTGTSITVATDTSESTKLSDYLSSIGLSTTVTAKSTGWPSTATEVAKYVIANNKWTPATGDATKNSKNPNKHLKEAFN